MNLNWTEEEDEILTAAVKRHGNKKWSVISKYFLNRVNRQCRERWIHVISPSIVKGGWTREEEKLIEKYVGAVGTKFSIIEKFLPGRTSNQIKNRYHQVINKPYNKNPNNIRKMIQSEPARKDASTSNCKE